MTLSNKDEKSEEVAGVVYISKKAMHPIYYAYATDGDMSKPLEQLLDNRWSDCHAHWNECLKELSAVSRLALDMAPVDVSNTTSSMNDSPLRFELSAGDDFRESALSIVFGATFIEGLYGLPPAERGLRILKEGQAHLNNTP